MSRKALYRMALTFAGMMAAAVWPGDSMAAKQKQEQTTPTSGEETGAYGGAASGQKQEGQAQGTEAQPVESGEKESTGAYGTGMQQRALDNRGQDFIKQSVQDTMGVSQLSKIAQQKASTPTVRHYAQTVIDEGQNVDKQLRSIASQNNITLPQSASDDLQQKQKNLQGMSGKDFDREYLNTVINNRQQNIDKFVEMAENKDAPAKVRTFAIQTLPTLRMQVMQGQDIQQQESQQGQQGQQGQKGKPGEQGMQPRGQ